MQVAINKRHKDSEMLFYNEWNKLVLKFPGITLKSTFIMEEVRQSRTTLQMKKQTHQQVYLAAEDVHKPLAEALKRIRDLQKEVESRPYSRQL